MFKKVKRLTESIDPMSKSENGWFLVPPVEWLAPLTAAQKAALPVGPKGDGIVVTDEGEVWMRLAKKDACWTNAAGECRRPETSLEAYADWQGFPLGFRTQAGEVVTEHVGHVAFDTGHAPQGRLSWRQVVDHYVAEVRAGRAGRWTQAALDNPKTAFANGKIHIDPEPDGSIWFHGAVAPHRTLVEVLLGSNSGSSGEWMRRVQGGIRHLAGICLVNAPAYRSGHAQRIAASATTGDPDRFVTYGEGWGQSLDEMLGAVDDQEYWEYSDRVAASIALELGDATEQLEAIAAAPEADELTGDVVTLDGAPAQMANGAKFVVSFDDDGDGNDGEDSADTGADNVDKLGKKRADAAIEALATSVDWRATSTLAGEKPATMDFEVFAMCEGVRSRDGRLIMKGATEMPHDPMPLMWERAGMSHSNQVLVGWLWTMERRPREDGGIDVVLLGTWAPTPEARELSRLKPLDDNGRIGLAVSVDGGEYEANVIWDEVNHPRLTTVSDNGKYLGAYSSPYYVFSMLEVAGVSVVSTPAIAQAGIREVAAVAIEEPIDRYVASVEMGGVSLKMARMWRNEMPGQPGSGMPMPKTWLTTDVRSVLAGRRNRLAARLVRSA